MLIKVVSSFDYSMSSVIWNILVVLEILVVTVYVYNILTFIYTNAIRAVRFLKAKTIVANAHG